MSPGEIAALCVALFGVWLRSMAAAAETALASVGPRDAREMADDDLTGASRLVQLRDRPDRTGASLRATEAIGLALAASLSGYLGLVLAPRLVPHPPAWLSHWLPLSGALVLALFAAGLCFFFGDLLSRAYGAAAAQKVARRLSLFTLIAGVLVWPLVTVSRVVADWILRPFGLDASAVRPVPPLEELERHLVTHAARGTLAAETPELIHQVFEFGETTAKEVMIPRTQVEALEIGASSSEVLSTLASLGHTRLPVYRHEIDDIAGTINAKDILPLVERGEPIELLKILRPAVFVPWSKPIGELMRELQQRHVHMAMVVDEFGGFMGVITLEDILEEIVGEIEDEFDRPESRDVEALPDGSFLVRGAMDIEDFNRTFSATLPDDEDYETVAGFLNALAGAIPAAGDTFFHDGLQLTVAKRNDRRVRQVRVRRSRPAAT